METEEVPMYMNSGDQYGVIARLLHWLVFILVVGMLMGGALLQVLPDGVLEGLVIGAHKSTGVVVGFLMGVRLIWRICNPHPKALSPHAVENYLAELVHICLYILLFLQPLVGILMSQTYGYPVTVFGLFSLPPIIWQSPQLGLFFGRCHSVIAALLAAAIAVHVGAALKHHFVNRDRTLTRMLSGR
jgi:cytochrome b561